MKILSRLKDRMTLLAIFTLVLFILKTYCKIEVPEADELINLLMIVLIGLGIVNNPTTKQF
jgi:uncharacterized membrane protein